MEPSRNRELSELAVATTGLGNFADKIAKNERKTLGLLRDIQDVATTGVIAERPELGLTEDRRPVGRRAVHGPCGNADQHGGQRAQMRQRHRPVAVAK